MTTVEVKNARCDQTSINDENEMSINNRLIIIFSLLGLISLTYVWILGPSTKIFYYAGIIPLYVYF